ncbi:GAF and ANTAR domain-containing protein [Williamsia sp. MIQD14]|uniref:GAF and ANTAR domain-containing protein n=1 Tax=Williamsia sp. MIQD14 TaxID=3425703 RepID=UPI003D9FF598
MTDTSTLLALAKLARTLHEQDDPAGEDALLRSITDSAVELVPGTEYCGITLVEKGELTSVAPTDDIAARVDAIQHEQGEGPCLDAAWANQIVRVDDYDTEGRWPTFVDAVRSQTPVRSTLSFQLYRGDATMGALNLYAHNANAFTDESEEVGLAVATHASLALFAARRDEQFASALASRDTIGQAKGIVMERFDVDAVQAWELMRKLSQDANIKVAELARKLIDADHPTKRRDLLN